MRISALIATSLVAVCFNATAERQPPRPQPLSEDGGAARVIVKFKDGASVLRAHALAADALPQTQERALAARASTLGARHGLALRSGAAVGEHEQVLHGPQGMTSQALAEQLSADPDVAYAEPDRRMRRLLVPNDTLFNAGGAQGPAVGQWYLRAPAGEVVSSINAVSAWDTTTGSASVIVAVLDTGVRPDHPDLAGKLVAGYDFITDTTISNDGTGRDADPADPGDWVTADDKTRDPANFGNCAVSPSSWHGTLVSGIVGAATNNAVGMAGAGWDVRVMPLRVLGKCFGYTSDIQAAMRWAAGIAVPGVPANPNPAKVINLSLGGEPGACSTAWRNAVADVNARGVVVVAAAGNSAGREASAPANCPGAIGVAGLRHVGSKVGFSDIGPELTIAAPGGNCVNDPGPCLYPILSTTDTGSFGPVGPSYTDSFDISVGTSFSSPLVAATAALMFSAKPDVTPAQVKAALQSSARPFPSSGLVNDTGVPLQACQAPGNSDQLQCYCTTTTCGAGMLDAGGAVAAVLAAPPPPAETGGGGGGGSMSPLWLLALAAAALLLRRRPPAGLGVAAALVLLAAPASAATAETPVHGLIVQLRDAPSHVALARERALGTAPSGGLAKFVREHARWQGLLAATPGLRIAERHAAGSSAQLLRLERPMSVAQAEAAAAELAQRPDVLWALPNTRERRLQATGPANAPTDPCFVGAAGCGPQWWLQPVQGSDGVPLAQRLRGLAGFQTAWASVTTGSASTVVAVLDNGITAHPDLAGKVINGYDMVSNPAFSNDGDGRDADPTDPGDWVDDNDLKLAEYAGCQNELSSWHGTAIAGILAANANNGQGGASINWPGKVLAVRVAAKCGADVMDIVDGMRWAAGLDVCKRSDGFGNCQEFLPRNPDPARVINISFGGSGSCDAYQGTINELRGLPNGGVLVVAAAGNEHAATPTRPAKCPGVIGVVALNRDGFKSTYSNFGSMLTVATAGGDDNDGAWGSRVADSGILSVGNTGSTTPVSSGYFNYFGTSFSTPVVAGAVGLMLSVNPALTAAQIEQGLRVSARAHVTSTLPGVAACSNANPGRCLCTTGTCGAGILDVPQALAFAATPTAYAPPATQPAAVNSAELRDAAAGGPDRPANSSEPPAGGVGSGGSTAGGSSDGGGGGTMSVWWLLALGAAVLVLRRRAVAA
jgi:serine protease